MNKTLKTLVELPRETWGQVKHYATIKDVSFSQALDSLLKRAFESQVQE